MILVRLSGYRKRTSFLVGNSLAQTSEFSLVILALGLGLGHISQGLFSTLVLLTILTMSLTSYFITHEKKLAKWFDWPLNIFNKYHSKKEELEYSDKNKKKVIIFGCHRAGSLILKEFENKKEELFVVDYNPEIIKSLIEKKIPCVYGDFMNSEVFAKTNVNEAEIIVSTIPDFEDNVFLVKQIRSINKKALVFVVANRIREAMALYKEGADYVILPQVEGGQRAYDLIKKFKKGHFSVKKMRKNHIKYLKSIHHILY
jgi:FlaA1/EpsC-like NDP-sugar epimerase